MEKDGQREGFSLQAFLKPGGWDFLKINLGGINGVRMKADYANKNEIKITGSFGGQSRPGKVGIAAPKESRV